MKKIFWFYFIGTGLLFTTEAWAGGAMMARQRMQNPQMQQQIMAQQQAMIQQQIAARQAAMMKAAMQEAQAAAVQKQVAQQAQAMVQQRNINQAKAMAQVVAERQAQETINIQRIRVHQNLPENIEMNVNVPIYGPEYTGETATIDDVVKALRTSSRDWNLILDIEAKALVVNQYLQEYRSQGVVINNSPEIYAQLIDQMAEQSPEMLNQPLAQILQVVAIIQYDFNNGQNKDAMALQVLGSQDAVQKNKARLGIP